MVDTQELDEATAQELSDMLDEPYRDYWAALGQFIHTFSHVEAVLQSFAFDTAGVSDALGRAVFHGLRVDAAKDAINRMLEATGQLGLKAELEAPFAQLGVIGGMRNNIVHWGANDVHGVGLVVTNKRLAHTAEKVRTYTVSADDLAAMTADLGTIMGILGFSMTRRLNPPNLPPWFDEMFRKLVQKPWRYKQPPQSPPKKTSGTRARRRERKRQHGA